VLREHAPLIAEVAGFLGAAGGVVLWIEVDDHPLAPELVQADAGSVLIAEAESWGGITNLQGHGREGRQWAKA
jgi:hypothetical protein